MIGSHPTKVFGIFVPSIAITFWDFEFLFQVLLKGKFPGNFSRLF
jgi:hypothetical protein